MYKAVTVNKTALQWEGYKDDFLTFVFFNGEPGWSVVTARQTRTCIQRSHAVAVTMGWAKIEPLKLTKTNNSVILYQVGRST